MNRLLFSILMTLFAASLFAQSVDQLDAKYGFKSLKFGTEPNTLKSVKRVSWDKNPNITEYKYIGDDVDVLFTVPVKEVSLTYYKGLLMNIMIKFNNTFSESDYNIVLHSLQKLFGDGNNCPINDPNYSISSGRKWLGKIVEMEIHRLYSTKYSKWGGYMTITKKSLQQKRISDEF